MKNIKVLKRLMRYIGPYKITFWSAITATVISVLANALWPFIMGLAVTEISQNLAQHVAVNFSYITKVIAMILSFALLYQTMMFLGSFLMTRAVQHAMRDLRRDINLQMNALPVRFFDSQQQGNILSRVTNDVDAITNALQQSLIQVVTSILGIIMAVVMMLTINLWMALLSLIMIPTSLLISKAIIKKSQVYFQGQQNTLGEMNGYVQENYGGFSVLKLYGQEERAVDEFAAITDRLTEFGFKAAFISGIMMPLVGLTTNLTYAGMATLGGYYVLHGVITVGNLQAFIQYIWQINQPISQITQLSGVMQAAAAATQRVFEILDEPIEPTDQETAELSADVQGKVEFKDVSFSYDPAKPLIRDLSFTANPGDKIAIVGPTGAGKTTMINLLMRFYDVSSGQILIDGVDTRQLSKQTVRSLFGMVLQDAWLYHTTITENIRFGKLDATEYEVVDAAKTANVDHFIHTLPNGYQMTIDEEADNVSLGQKQLLTIARAVIANPKILILDEATSSVDTRLESLLQKAMEKVMQGRTSFVIAHRLSTIRDANLILVMDHGQIVEKGTHDDLLAANGVYAKLYNSQFAEAKLNA
ncbi:ABC transporter ATP-binding protein [Latilactobacillus sakei]|uniref:ABC transporter ATP-binding protein n=1 Tax=Latilactobacillus sakei TaxID=1599 RepID=A0AAX0VBP2_LATSK|nr:ABC transporter ATP-binding protein [Latilactobacillus sakei]ASN12679.1 ABC transporter [Latilactobacillus sakei]MCM1634921.1 ABC transporter ATP-binding protein/permease [Latilactobacillus sakei]PKX62091.1 ABC transporter ATP-binding protein [Latilactobacillus sakei]PKX69596.1 ABC transporter ATP-binding protein [Latilactobacillus sakei]PKX71379.1 ABC transporter ATP-binding protein [Latilactobacillus sakei]